MDNNGGNLHSYMASIHGGRALDSMAQRYSHFLCAEPLQAEGPAKTGTQELAVASFIEARAAQGGVHGAGYQATMLEALMPIQRMMLRDSFMHKDFQGEDVPDDSQEGPKSVTFDVFETAEQVLARLAPPIAPMSAPVLLQSSSNVFPKRAMSQTPHLVRGSAPLIPPSSRLESQGSAAHQQCPMPRRPVPSSSTPPLRQPPLPQVPTRGQQAAHNVGDRDGRGRGLGGGPEAAQRPVFSTAAEVRGISDKTGRKLPLNGGDAAANGWDEVGHNGRSRGPQYNQYGPGANGQRQGTDGFLSSRLTGRSNDSGPEYTQYDEQEGITPLPGASTAVRKRFVPPTRTDAEQPQGTGGGRGQGIGGAPGTARAMANRALQGPAHGSSTNSGRNGNSEDGQIELPERLKGCDPVLVERIENDIIDRGDPITFEDIAGLAFAKKCVMELVCWPMARPDIFTGLRSLPKGLLLFGPPGTGKTLIGKAIACQSGATFFNISASSLTSKWIGEGEKLVRTLFAVAGHYQPSIIFIDEVDSLLCQRSSEENESSRRLKTEFLVQLDGAGTSSEDRVLVVGATNRPQELDEAARRRFVKRLYIPLPEAEARHALISILLKKNPHRLTPQEIDEVVSRTAGFSGADLRSLCTEAAMGPIRDMATDISNVSVADVPPIQSSHFVDALSSIRPSVSSKDLGGLRQWNAEYGTFPRSSEESLS